MKSEVEENVVRTWIRKGRPADQLVLPTTIDPTLEPSTKDSDESTTSQKNQFLLPTTKTSDIPAVLPNTISSSGQLESMSDIGKLVSVWEDEYKGSTPKFSTTELAFAALSQEDQLEDLRRYIEDKSADLTECKRKVGILETGLHGLKGKANEDEQEYMAIRSKFHTSSGMYNNTHQSLYTVFDKIGSGLTP